MAVKNFWALTPSEAIVAWELQQRGFHVFFPTKDVGVDLMVLQELNKARRRPITIQVKDYLFSVYFDVTANRAPVTYRNIPLFIDMLSIFHFFCDNTADIQTVSFFTETFRAFFFHIPPSIL